MFPLSSVLFPGGTLPLHVFEPRYRQLVTDCLEGDLAFGVVLIARGSEVGGGDERFGVGTEAHIEQASPLPDGRWVLVASGDRRLQVDAWLDDAPYPRALVRTFPSTGAVAEEALRRARHALQQVGALLAELGNGLWRGVPVPESGSGPEDRLWRLCDAGPLGELDRQRLLELDELEERAAALATLAEDACGDLRALLAEGTS